MPDHQEAAPKLQAPLVDTIVRHRNVLWGILIGIYALAFTGQWRVGRDSALYRGLAHALASGRGYTFGEFGSRQVYPGLPVLLAGLEKVFSLAAWPGILVMHAMALGCLIFTYKLVRLRYPEWLAILVTFVVGINGWFIELTNELLTDIPFLLGLLAALYGWERLRIALLDDANQDRKKFIRPLVYLILGLALAAVMRPTFWVLAIAWVMVCIWGLIAGPKRKFYAICLGILLVIWLVVALLDPRIRGFNPLKGGYEQDAIRSLEQVKQNVRKNIPDMTDKELNFSFFGQRWWPTAIRRPHLYIPGMTDVMSVLVIVGALMLWRVNPLWTLLVLFTIAVTLVMTVVPRYYIMVLPLLVLGWFLLTIKIAQLVPRRWVEVVLIVSIAIVVGMNFTRAVRVIGEQHAWNAESDEEGPKWEYVIDMGKRVNELVPQGEKVIAPGASIMAFVSDRECVMQRDILPATIKSPLHYPEHLAALGIRYAVFPSRLYRKGDRVIRDLMDRRVIVPTARIAKEGDMALATIEIKVPPPGVDWRKQPLTTTPFTVKSTPGGTTRPSAKVMVAKKHHAAAQKKVLADRKRAALAKIEKKKREERQLAAARAAAKKRHARHKKPVTTTAPVSLNDVECGNTVILSVLAKDLGLDCGTRSFASTLRMTAFVV